MYIKIKIKSSKSILLSERGSTDQFSLCVNQLVGMLQAMKRADQCYNMLMLKHASIKDFNLTHDRFYCKPL